MLMMCRCGFIGETLMIYEEEKVRRSDLETSDEERFRRSSSRAKSFKKRAVNASNRITHTLRKRSGKRVAPCQYASISIDDVRDAEEEEAVNEFRQTLISKDLLPPRHDDYHTMLR